MNYQTATRVLDALNYSAKRAVSLAAISWALDATSEHRSAAEQNLALSRLLELRDAVAESADLAATVDRIVAEHAPSLCESGSYTFGLEATP